MEFRGQEEPAEGMGASSAPPVAPSRAAPALGVGNGTGRDRRGLRELAVRRCRECSELLALAIRHHYTLTNAHHAYVSRCAPSSLCSCLSAAKSSSLTTNRARCDPI